jgi:hypothetical protein
MAARARDSITSHCQLLLTFFAGMWYAAARGRHCAPLSGTLDHGRGRRADPRSAPPIPS